MKVAFRADASLAIGTGHVMRCLTLAKALRERGHDCQFITRAHSGHLMPLIREEGFTVHALPLGQQSDDELAHASWLGASQAEDANACERILAAWRPDWVVVDHYALDHRWEKMACPDDGRILVIDDLADRVHACDVLLDQNLGRREHDYQALLPPGCLLHIGPRYALLRPEFAALRHLSLSRRQALNDVRHILVALGGVDQYDHTSAVLNALRRCDLPDDVHCTVVLGRTAPHVEAVKRTANDVPWPVTVLAGIPDMAERMVEADLAIGAAGSSAWERCALGLPTLLVLLAENQKFGGKALSKSGAAILIQPDAPLDAQLQKAMATLREPFRLQRHSVSASEITDGLGCQRIVTTIESHQ
jgi:UDP-2,4-diacetamido-2,4,6-trideoxy-beta-L-altropyranose hydrolase